MSHTINGNVFNITEILITIVFCHNFLQVSIKPYIQQSLGYSLAVKHMKFSNMEQCIRNFLETMMNQENLFFTSYQVIEVNGNNNKTNAFTSWLQSVSWSSEV